MKKVFSKKIFIPALALILCFAVAFGTVVLAANSSYDIIIHTNTDDTVKRYQDENGKESEEDAIYLGEGINEWDMALGPDAIEQYKMSDAYFEVTAQRILKIKPNMVRLMIQPWYLCYMDDGDAGETKWNAAEDDWRNADLNYNTPYMYNFWRYLEVFQAAGTVVELNYGYTNPKPMCDWFGIKDVPVPENHLQKYGYASTSAPRNLQAFANNLAALLIECENRGFIATKEQGGREASTIQYVNFYNEVQYNHEYLTFGDKRPYWCRMLRYVHEALIDAGFRSDADEALNDRDMHRIKIIGLESSLGGAAFSENTRKFIDYLYTNAYKRGYCDMFDTHQYLDWAANPKSKINRGTLATNITEYARKRWPMDIKGSHNILIAEHGAMESGTTYSLEIGAADNKQSYSGLANPFDGTCISQAIGYSLGGTLATLNWFCHDNFYPRNPNFLNFSFVHFWSYPSATGTKDGKTMGIEGVNSTFGESIFMRYLPDNAKVAKSTVDDNNKDKVRLATYMNEKDTAVVAEFDCYGGTTEGTGVTSKFNYNDYLEDKKDGKWDSQGRTVRINLDKRNGTYYKYVHEYCEGSFINSTESQSIFDGNAIMPDGEPMTVLTDSNGNYYIEDTISTNHCLVIYSTVPPMKQIALDDDSREIEYSLSKNTTGVQIKVDTDACVQIKNATFTFDVFRGMVDPFAEGSAPKYLSDKNGFDKASLEKTYLNTVCNEYKKDNYNETSQTYTGATLNKRAGTVTRNADGTSATYTRAIDAQEGDTIAVRVKLADDNKPLLSKVNNGASKLQVYDTDDYAVSIIKIVA